MSPLPLTESPLLILLFEQKVAMPSSITSRPSSRPSTPEPVSSPSSPSAPSPQGLTVGERMKRRKAANRKRKAKSKPFYVVLPL